MYVEMARTPQKGPPEEAVPELLSVVEEFAEAGNIRRFYIGQAMDLKEAQSKSKAHDVFSLYETFSLEGAMLVLRALTNAFADHPKRVEDPCAAGEETDEHSKYVYIGVWYAT